MQEHMEDCRLAFAKNKTWHTPVCETLDLAATAGGPPGGADAHSTTGNSGCSPLVCS